MTQTVQASVKFGNKWEKVKAVVLSSAVAGATTLATAGTVFTLDKGQLDGISHGAMDVAKSLVSLLAQLLPVLVPVIVVGFILGFVISLVRHR